MYAALYKHETQVFNKTLKKFPISAHFHCSMKHLMPNYRYMRMLIKAFVAGQDRQTDRRTDRGKSIALPHCSAMGELINM